MFSLFKKNKLASTVPEWASFFDERDYNAFVKALDIYFGKKKINYTLGDGMLSVKENDFGFNTLGLMNVAQVCKQHEIRDYNDVVQEHFESLIRSNIFDVEFSKIVHDFEQVKKYIKVRLYANDYVAHRGKDLTIGKDFAGDIYAMLVFDLPHSIINIKSEQADKWPKSLEELFEFGIQNTKSSCPVETTLEKFNDFNIWFVQAEHFFTPNIVFDLKNHPKLIGSKGSLVGIPHRHAVLVYPIESLEVTNAINNLIPTIYGMNEEGPGSISNNLFWYKDGVFENLPYKLESNKLEFFPTENFIEVLNSLPSNNG